MSLFILAAASLVVVWWLAWWRPARAAGEVVSRTAHRDPGEPLLADGQRTRLGLAEAMFFRLAVDHHGAMRMASLVTVEGPHLTLDARNPQGIVFAAQGKACQDNKWEQSTLWASRTFSTPGDQCAYSFCRIAIKKR